MEDKNKQVIKKKRADDYGGIRVIAEVKVIVGGNSQSLTDLRCCMLVS